MIKFIVLTSPDKTQVTINVAHLVRYSPLVNEMTNIVLTGGDFMTVTVTETKTQIDNLIMTSGCEIWERESENIEEIITEGENTEEDDMEDECCGCDADDCDDCDIANV